MIEYSPLFLIPTVLILGFRHGFDLDHIATIDALTRAVKSDNWLAKWVGVLFSLGHGLIVILVSIVIGSGFLGIIPDWINALGQWISIFFLLTFGLMTLWSLQANTNEPNVIAGPKSLIVQKLWEYKQEPLSIVMVGSLFALSFDTLSLVAIFSISASKMAGWLFSMTLGLVFMFGMMISDGLNGLFVAKILAQANVKSHVFAQIAGILIAVLSLSLGLIGLLEILN